MPEEHTYNQPPGFRPEPQNNAAPKTQNQVNPAVYPQPSNPEQGKTPAEKKPEAFSEFGGGNSRSIVPNVLVWLAFVIVLALTGYFWLIDYGNVKSISEKENEKNQIVAQLSSADNKETEEKAQGFSTAFNELSALINNGVLKGALLTNLYTHFTKDVKISTIALSNEGGLAIDGAAGSYRQVADFILGIKGGDKVSNVVLKSVSLDTDEGVAADQKITFSISADMQMTKEEAKADTGSESSSPSEAASDISSTNQ